MRVALVHDYLTQRGGAERVVAAMVRAFPEAPVYTSLYDPGGTFPEFRDADVRTLGLNRFGVLRRHHRLALPLFARAFSHLEVSADVVICSSSGWAHGTSVDGRKFVYCHNPARWLYQSEDYLGGRRSVARAALGILGSRLRKWDQRAAQSADLYLCNSSVVQERVRSVYDIEAELLPPPHSIDIAAPQRAVEGLTGGFLLCVSRLLPYKNVGAIVQAFAGLPDEQLVIVGTGPQEARLRAAAGPNVRLLGSIPDEELRWLYANCAGVIAASREDYGLTPLEGAAFGKPSAVLRWGGFLDTVDEGTTGVFFAAPTPEAIRETVIELAGSSWDGKAIQAHAERYSEPRFIERLRAVVLGEPARTEEAIPA